MKKYILNFSFIILITIIWAVEFHKLTLTINKNRMVLEQLHSKRKPYYVGETVELQAIENAGYVFC
jgi:NOL1/NOP2/fmu family ribosome biogenesis protein